MPTTLSDTKDQKRYSTTLRWRAANKERYLSKFREWEASHPHRKRPRQLLIKFNLTEKQYASLVDAQCGVCAICRLPETELGNGGKSRALSVDHNRNCCAGDWSCGKCIRGLLCNACNKSLGFFGDSPDRLRAAAQYVESYPLQTK